MSFVNEAGWDRIARVVLGIVLLVVGLGVVGGTGVTVLAVVGLIPLLTGAVGYCPIYSVLHLRTNHQDETATKA